MKKILLFLMTFSCLAGCSKPSTNPNEDLDDNQNQNLTKVENEVFEIVAISEHEEFAYVIFDNETPNHQIWSDVSYEVLGDFKIGDIVLVTYLEETKCQDDVPTKCYPVYYVTKMEKSNSLYVNEYLFADIVNFKPVKIIIEAPALASDDSDFVTLTTEKEISALLNRFNDVIVYSDYVEIHGVGGAIFYVAFHSDDGRIISFKDDGNLEVTYFNENTNETTTKSFGYHRSTDILEYNEIFAEYFSTPK